MHFCIATDIFREGIQVVGHVGVPNNMTPVLENILITVTENTLILLANNLEMAIEYTLSDTLNVMKSWSFTISSRFLSSFLAVFWDDLIEIQLRQPDMMVFSWKSGETTVKGISASEFPVLPEIEYENTHNFPPKYLRDAFSKTTFSAASGNVRPTLAGVFIGGKDSHICFASTDSFRLSEWRYPLDTSESMERDIVVPIHTVTQLGKIVGEKFPVKICFSENQILIACGPIRIFSRLIHGYFPDYLAFFPTSHNTRGVLFKSTLIKLLKQISLISKDNAYNIHVTFFPDVGVELETLTQTGQAQLKLAWDVSGTQEKVGLNSAYFLEVLNVIKTDYIVIDFESPLSPIQVRGIDGEGTIDISYRHILMPLKV